MLFVALKGFTQLKGKYYFQSKLKKTTCNRAWQRSISRHLNVIYHTVTVSSNSNCSQTKIGLANWHSDETLLV